MAVKIILFAAIVLAVFSWVVIFAAAIQSMDGPEKEAELKEKAKVKAASHLAWPCTGVAFAAILWLIIF